MKLKRFFKGNMHHDDWRDFRTIMMSWTFSLGLLLATWFALLWVATS